MTEADTESKALPDETAQPSFATLSSRVMRRTTDLIGIGIGIAVCLAVGLRFSEWWNEPEASPDDTRDLAASVTGADPMFGQPNVPVDLRFGASGVSFQREEIIGTQEEAFERLLNRMAERLPHAQPLTANPTESERKLLVRLRNIEPIATVGNRELHAPDGPFSMVAGIEPLPPATDGVSDFSVGRLLLWGVVLNADPLGEEPLGKADDAKVGARRYRLFLCHATPEEESNAEGWPPLSVPTGSQSLLSLRSATGGVFLSFVGYASIAEWETKITKQMLAQDWEPVRGWSQTGLSSRCRFTAKDGPSPGWIDVVITGEAVSGRDPQPLQTQRRLRGLFASSPVRE